MKKIVKILIVCCILAALVIWNGIYMDYISQDGVRWGLDCSLEYLLMFIPKGIVEELIFRYLPFMLAIGIYVGMRKMGPKWAKISIVPLAIFILAVQFVFSSLHIPLDPLYREMFYNLPPRPTFGELFNIFLLQGVVGISLCAIYVMFISKEKPFTLLQGKSLLACCIVHILYNQLVVTIY
jgi:hypothetical protein